MSFVSFIIFIFYINYILFILRLRLQRCESYVRMISRAHRHSTGFLRSNEDIPIHQSTRCVDFREHSQKESGVVRSNEETSGVEMPIVSVLEEEESEQLPTRFRKRS